jgi:hypothetical protein
MKIEERIINAAAENSTDQATLALLQSENINLRRMIVELIEQNQRLRERFQRMEIHRDVAAGNNDPAIRVDPQAA